MNWWDAAKFEMLRVFFSCKLPMDDLSCFAAEMGWQWEGPSRSNQEAWVVPISAVLWHIVFAGAGGQMLRWKHFSFFLPLLFFFVFVFFQGPIGLDGKPVSKQSLWRLCALPPARSHSPTSLHATEYVFKRIILQCHAHAWIKWKSEGWWAGGCHKCLGGVAGGKRLGRASVAASFPGTSLNQHLTRAAANLLQGKPQCFGCWGTM